MLCDTLCQVQYGVLGFVVRASKFGTLPITSCVNLGKLLNFSDSVTSHLEMATIKSLRGLNELMFSQIVRAP